MKLETINWPVFLLGNIDVTTVNSVSYKETEVYLIEEERFAFNKLIIDDKNIKEDTLSLRRLVLMNRGVNLFPIQVAIYFLADLIKIAKNKVQFIDSSGNIFKYEKFKPAPLTCHRLKNILPSVGVGVIIEVEGITQRFKLMFEPNDEQQYVGLLKLNNSYLLYGMYNEPFKKTYRKI